MTGLDDEEDADLGAPVRAFGATVEARSWLPRAATEFAVHRGDAEGAGPGPTPLGAVRAGESLDETLRVFWPAIAAFEWPAGPGREAGFPVPSEPIGVRAVDTGRSWRLFPDGGRMSCVETTGQPGTELPETVLEGAGADLVLYLWGRQDGSPIRAHGSLELIRSWNVVAHFGI